MIHADPHLFHELTDEQRERRDRFEFHVSNPVRCRRCDTKLRYDNRTVGLCDRHQTPEEIDVPSGNAGRSKVTFDLDEVMREKTQDRSNRFWMFFLRGYLDAEQITYRQLRARVRQSSHEDIPQTTLRDYTNCRVMCPIDRARMIAAALGVTICDLTGVEA